VRFFEASSQKLLCGLIDCLIIHAVYHSKNQKPPFGGGLWLALAGKNLLEWL
jgi:hypothetical protein